MDDKLQEALVEIERLRTENDKLQDENRELRRRKVLARMALQPFANLHQLYADSDYTHHVHVDEVGLTVENLEFAARLLVDLGKPLEERV